MTKKEAANKFEQDVLPFLSFDRIDIIHLTRCWQDFLNELLKTHQITFKQFCNWSTQLKSIKFLK